MLSDKTWRLALGSNSSGAPPVDPYALLAWTKGPRFRRHVLNQLGGTDAKNISRLQFLSAPFPTQHPEALADFGVQVRSLLRARARVSNRHLAATNLFATLAARTLNS